MNKEQLSQRIGNMDNYTYFLRRSLRKVGSTLRLTTVRGIGYRLEEGNT